MYMDIQSWVRSGNILAACPEPRGPGRYLANGRFGTVIGAYGLNADPEEQRRHPNDGRSHFSHMSHWGRFRFLSSATGGETTADYLLPLFSLHWEREPEDVRDYRQEQDFYNGTVQTVFTDGQGRKISILSWFDWKNKDLAGFRFEVSGSVTVRLTVADGFIPYPFLYRKQTGQQSAAVREKGQWKISIRCPDTVNQAQSDIWLRTDGQTEACENGVRIRMENGVYRLFLSFGAPAADCDTSLTRTTDAWHGLWDQSGLMSFPDERAQQTYIRSLAYLLASYDDDADAVQPTCGLTGNMFPFHFVQDMEYIAPALMMTGHGRIVRRWTEHFAGLIPQMRRYARRLWPETEGLYPPWELPYGDMDDYHTPAMPVPYCYEPHNTGYLCRMAREAAEEYGCEAWTESFAKPLIRECAAFYRSAAEKREDGRWHLVWFPAIGQDEAGGRNGQDYLCSLYSALYCFRSAVLFGLDDEGVYAGMLRDGLAFPALLAEDGTYHTALGADDRGRQKHPVQLDGLAYMPVSAAPEEPERAAYAIRYELTARAKEPFFFGWTLGEFLLAGANLGDAEGFLRDWKQMRPSDYTDAGWVQIYETSGESEKSFYMTTHGLVLQSLIRLYVNDYRGRTELAGCPVWPEAVFRKIRTRQGCTVTGKYREGRCAFEAAADRDSIVSYGMEAENLKAGGITAGSFPHRTGTGKAERSS